MTKRLLLALFLLLFLNPAFLTAKEKVRVAAAANMQFVIQKIAAEFGKETGIEIEIISGASGKLAAQIKEGAPFDVFVSADMVFPQDLYKAGFGLQEPKPYATGQLVLWTVRPDVTPDAGLAVLLQNNVHKIAIANAKTAPYGLAAEEVLKYYKLYDRIKDKLVFGENIGQTQQFVASQAADIGFVAKSLVLSDDLKEKGKWVDISPSAYSPIVQGAILLKREKPTTLAAATKFYNYLYAATAKRILERYGFVVK